MNTSERGLVFLLGFMLLGNALAFEISGVVAVSGFLSEVSATNILWVWLIDMLLIALAAGLYSLVVDHFNRKILIRWLTLTLAVIYLGLRFMFTLDIAPWFNYALLYLVAEQQWFFFPLIFWVLASDVIEIAPSKRLFPIIAAFGFIGKLIGISIAALSPRIMDQMQASNLDLLYLNAIIYVLVFLTIWIGLRKIKIRKSTHQEESLKEMLTEGRNFVRDVPIFRFLTISIIMMIAIETFIEYRFLEISSERYRDSSDYQTYYSIYRLAFVIAAIVVQSLLTGRLVSRWGLRHTTFVLPIFAAGALGWMLALPGLASGLGGILLNKIPLYSVDESTRKGFQALIPEERRGRVSIFMDSYIYALGAIVGVAMIALAITVGDMQDSVAPYVIYLGVGLVMAILAIVALLRLRAVYDVSLMNWRLRRRQRSTSLIDNLDFDS
jgi:ATP/ADP translocase